LFGHLAQVGLWAGFLVWLGALQTYHDAFYFSLVTFATLSYGDIARLFDAEPGNIKRWQEQQGQQSGDKEAADNRVGHRAQQTSDAIGIMPGEAAAAVSTIGRKHFSEVPASGSVALAM
jgi:hypothetical protein